ncbi:MAG: hypothetical protein ACOCRX_01460 [Candidatus Woesearchaeota archaeon]
MNIYHGTNAKFLSSVLTQGIIPREKTNGNWDNAISKEGHTYLTITFPFVFSFNTIKNNNEKQIIIEIDFDRLNKSKLFPDEDFIWHILHLNDDEEEADIEKAKELVEYNQNLWKESLYNIGNVSYKGTILPNLIKRIAIIDYKKMNDKEKLILASFADTTMSPIAFKARKEIYFKQIKWIFNDIDDFVMYYHSKKQQNTIKKINQNKNEWLTIRDISK